MIQLLFYFSIAEPDYHTCNTVLELCLISRFSNPINIASALAVLVSILTFWIIRSMFIVKMLSSFDSWSKYNVVDLYLMPQQTFLRLLRSEFWNDPESEKSQQSNGSRTVSFWIRLLALSDLESQNKDWVREWSAHH